MATYQTSHSLPDPEFIKPRYLQAAQANTSIDGAEDR
jgi:hypothetical protein